MLKFFFLKCKKESDLSYHCTRWLNENIDTLIMNSLALLAGHTYRNMVEYKLDYQLLNFFSFKINILIGTTCFNMINCNVKLLETIFNLH